MAQDFQILISDALSKFASQMTPISAMVQSSFQDFENLVNPIGQAVVDWARPEGWPVVPPTKGWPMTDFSTAAAIVVVYLVFVALGRVLMQLFPPVSGLYPLKFLYNMSQVMLCSYMCIEAGVRAYSAGYSILPCNKIDQENPPIGFILYVFYLSKILDFADTFFIVAEKRWKQLSFLHVYHHASIFLFYWLNVQVAFDGEVYMTIVLNGLIHMVMYTYYFVSLHTKEIWWKSALTTSQIIQFVVMNAQAIYLLVTECPRFPRNIAIAYGYYILSMLVLFTHFFIVSYGGKRKSSSSRTRDKEQKTKKN